MTARPKVTVDTTPAQDTPQPTYGFGRQSRGSRVGLGGDLPNAAIDRLRPRRSHEPMTQGTGMEDAGQTQKLPGS